MQNIADLQNTNENTNTDSKYKRMTQCNNIANLRWQPQEWFEWHQQFDGWSSQCLGLHSHNPPFRSKEVRPSRQQLYLQLCSPLWWGWRRCRQANLGNRTTGALGTAYSCKGLLMSLWGQIRTCVCLNLCSSPQAAGSRREEPRIQLPP